MARSFEGSATDPVTVTLSLTETISSESYCIASAHLPRS